MRLKKKGAKFMEKIKLKILDIHLKCHSPILDLGKEDLPVFGPHE